MDFVVGLVELGRRRHRLAKILHRQPVRHTARHDSTGHVRITRNGRRVRARISASSSAK